MTKKTLSKEAALILDKLKREFGETVETASKEDLYKASAMCIRDEIMDKWTAANQRQTHEKM